MSKIGPISTRSSLVAWVLVLFYALAVYKFTQGMWMHQMQPHFFTIPFDGTAWLVMQTGLPAWLAGRPNAWLLMDLVFFVWPLAFVSLQKLGSGWRLAAGILWFLINIVYLTSYTIYPSNSIESYVAWFVFPLVLAARSETGFQLMMQAARYFFLFFFASAGLWKIAQGGIFHIDQMSGILLQQHGAQLLSNPYHGYSRFIYHLIQRPALSYGFYAAGTLLELSFIAGFFTRRYDKWLVIGFIAFLLMDLLLMKIPYFETLPMLLTLLFIPASAPDTGTNAWPNRK